MTMCQLATRCLCAVALRARAGAAALGNQAGQTSPPTI